MKDFLIIVTKLYAYVGVAILIVLTIFYIGNIALNKNEVHECLLWKDQAIEYHDAGFYLTGWQYAQCLAHNIVIDAPVIGASDSKIEDYLRK